VLWGGLERNQPLPDYRIFDDREFWTDTSELRGYRVRGSAPDNREITIGGSIAI